MPEDPIRVLIICEHASARFGGEASLPLHYFRVLLARGHPVWLITHARVREELVSLFPKAQGQIRFVEDNALHVLLWRIGRWLPSRLASFSTGFISRLVTQRSARRLAREIISRARVNVVHQPIPVSPKEPSLLHGLGVPVVIGPMNGGMTYPPGLEPARVRLESWLIAGGRAMAGLINRIVPGKRRAAALLVANERTRKALPLALANRSVLLPENGVDLGLWECGSNRYPPNRREDKEDGVTKVVFLGRLVDWKATDLLLEAFDAACRNSNLSLSIFGDGPERDRLTKIASTYGRISKGMAEGGKVYFGGWQTQAACAALLRHHDVLVLPSLYECGGAVVLEAMACGLPVIATAWGGPLDYINDECGILVPPTSREELVSGLEKALQRLAADPELRARMGAAGRARIENEFDWERKVDQVLEIYAGTMHHALSSPQ